MELDMDTMDDYNTKKPFIKIEVVCRDCGDKIDLIGEEDYLHLYKEYYCTNCLSNHVEEL